MLNGVSSSSNIFDYLQTTNQKSRPGDLFSKTDTDGSGEVSQSELETLVEQISTITGTSVDTENALSTYDSDSSGELSDEELKSFMEATMQPPMGMMGMQGLFGFFNQVDTDASGGISETELTTLAANISDQTGQTLDISDAISTYDSDGDGELSDTELKSFMGASGVKPPPPPPPTMGMNRTSGDEEEISATAAESIISSYDTDSDGVLNSSELQTYLDSLKESSAQKIFKATA
jgi:Ca2+-binding EF-hand superfamily protein